MSTVVGFLYQLSGSEEIKFNPKTLTIRKNILGWERIREYPIQNCTELEWTSYSGEYRRTALRCKMGWRMIYFAEYMSEEQATEILTGLQQHLPDVARSMGLVLGSSKPHFTTLGLSH